MKRETIYEEHTIGQHIVKFELKFEDKETASGVLRALNKQPEAWPKVEHIFVVSSSNKLLGAIPFSRLLAAAPEKPLRELVLKDYPSVHEHAHQSNVAKIALKRGAGNIPVVDAHGYFVGVIDSTQILTILHEEHVEELMNFSGILTSEEFIHANRTGLAKIVLSRLPWLIVGLIGGVVAANIIGFFEGTLETQLILATFIPLIVYMADAIGTQTETILVRNITIEPSLSIKKFFIKEIAAGFVISIICGLLISIYSFVRYRSFYLGAVLGLSLVSATVIAVVVGTLVPWLISKLKKDPALGTGPLTTVIQDVASVTVYFVIASMLLSLK